MKIAFVSTVFGIPYGGAEVATELLIKNLRADGHEVYAITTRKPIITLKRIIKLDLLSLLPTSFFVPGNKATDYLIAFFLRKKLKELDLDIIHTTDAFILPATVKANSKLGLPVVVTCHQSLYVDRTRSLYKRIINCTFQRRNKAYLSSIKRVQAVITVSNYVKNSLLSNGVDGTKLHTIPNIVDYDLNREVITSHKDNIILLTSGRLVSQKGIDVSIKALKLIVKERSNAKLIIAGDGPELLKLKQLSQTLGLQSFITFTGWVSRQQMRQLYTDCDIVLLPSVYPEASPMVLTEAMSSGRPVIASNIGGIPELVNNNITGFLVPAGDEYEIAEAALKLCNDAVLRDRMGKAGKEFIQNYLDNSEIIKETTKVYSKIQLHC